MIRTGASGKRLREVVTAPRQGRGRAVAVGLMVASLAGAAAAQTLETRHVRTLVVGTPSGGARVDRVNRGRTGQVHDALPVSGLHIDWQTAFLGMVVEQAPLVDGAGRTYVIGGQGDVVAIGPDGSEVWRASTGVAQPGPGALLSDGSVVFVSASGEAVAVREGHIRWRTRFGRAELARPAPLPLEDGGVVVATARELSALDADGNERARAALPEPAAAPLVAALGAPGRVLVVAASGTVYAWAVGGELARVGSFGSPVDQGAALVDDPTLVAVTSGHTHLTTVDLARGTATTRAIAPAGLWLGPPATQGGAAHLLALTQTSDLLVSLDGAGNEVGRTLLNIRQPQLAPDGGPVALVVPPHVPPIVDSTGVVAFVTSQGAGVAKPGGGGGGPGGSSAAAAVATVEFVADICPAASSGAAAGLAPLGPGAFVVACRAGTLIAIRGQR